MDCFGSHLPFLINALIMCDGPVAELGMGEYSTPILFELCRGRRPFTSFESEPDWFHRYDHLPWGGLSARVLLDDWDDLQQWHPEQFSVVFIDQDELDGKRKLTAPLFRDTAMILVVHDSQSENCFDPTMFKYVKRCPRYYPDCPETAYASNRLDVSQLV